ncbi:MAG TPA: hypothetical protein IAB68_01370 [Candidatus Aphodocola excrementigallinarum]|uniref:Uncharacterized protein n=1 Tax=Candidatus Aphodocola excrementigallinarum TaxID=2840670 RepID=A0A9D1IM86_9FIRM|nr:hypothetical protein [Candidatus Aphodocola excrementigallinarum]
MKMLDKNTIKKHMVSSFENYASVCSSCACGGGVGSCNTTCKGCKDKNENIKEVRNVYDK